MIYIVKHKPCITPMLRGYKDLEVGSRETLARYNRYINEATALYEIWKKDDEIKGLVHYRRFFYENEYLLPDKVENILQKYDVITTTDFAPPTPLEHLVRNLDEATVKKYVYQLPKYVIKWFESYQEFNICNMFVSRRNFIDAYCEWMFPLILPLLEQFIDEDLRDDVKHNRTIGFIIECLFGYWCKDFDRYKMGVRVL